ncbi:MAG: hypothetical protein ACLUI5_04630 [Fusicatenibacter saccharivorans]
MLGKFFLSRFQIIHLMRCIKVKMLFYLDLMYPMRHILCLREKSFNKEDLQEVHKLIKKYIKFSDAALAKYKNELSNINPKEMIGLYLRGTDYTKLKPDRRSRPTYSRRGY